MINRFNCLIIWKCIQNVIWIAFEMFHLIIMCDKITLDTIIHRYLIDIALIESNWRKFFFYWFSCFRIFCLFLVCVIGIKDNIMLYASSKNRYYEQIKIQYYKILKHDDFTILNVRDHSKWLSTKFNVFMDRCHSRIANSVCFYYYYFCFSIVSQIERCHPNSLNLYDE